ncbi:hypothetical protein BD779DRAFT_1569270, partial [Infundibulicybe gibba]
IQGLYGRGGDCHARPRSRSQTCSVEGPHKIRVCKPDTLREECDEGADEVPPPPRRVQEPLGSRRTGGRLCHHLEVEGGVAVAQKSGVGGWRGDGDVSRKAEGGGRGVEGMWTRWGHARAGDIGGSFAQQRVAWCDCDETEDWSGAEGLMRENEVGVLG